MELEWKESIKIQDGLHDGEITRIEYKTDPYEYTDIYIKVDNTDFEIKYGCPSILSEGSKLGKLLIAMGAKFEKGKKIDPEKVLVGTKVKFMSITKKAKDGKEYSNVVDDSIKPAVPIEKVI